MAAGVALQARGGFAGSGAARLSGRSQAPMTGPWVGSGDWKVTGVPGRASALPHKEQALQ